MKYKFGDIILFKPTTFLGKLIAFFDGSPYSHAGIFIKYEAGVPLFIESHEKKGGVVITELEDWANFVVFRANLPHIDRKQLLGLLGTKYNYSMLWWILGAKIHKHKIYNKPPTELICSVLVDHFYKYQIGGGYVCTPATIERFYQDGNLTLIK